MNNPINLAEMANTANYAEMDYKSLCEINLAFTWAMCNVKTLLKQKRMEEMESITKEYITTMNRYLATKEEILSCLEKGAKEEIEKSSDAQNVSNDVDDQTPDSPEPSAGCQVSEENEAMEECNESTLPNAPELESNGTSANSGDKNPIEKAIEAMKNFHIPEKIDTNKPYYYERVIEVGPDGKYISTSSFGKNMDNKTLESFKEASYCYIKHLLCKKEIVSRDNFLATDDGKGQYIIREYHYSDNDNGIEPETQQSGEALITKNESRKIKHKHRIMKEAIEIAKQFSLASGDDIHTSFFDRYKFFFDKQPMRNEQNVYKRQYEDESTLITIASALETYARIRYDEAEVISVDNGVAVMLEGNIFVLFCYIPEKEPKEYKKPILSESPKPMDGKKYVITEQGYIDKAVELAKEKAKPHRHIKDETSSPRFIQDEFSINEFGEVKRSARRFSQKIKSNEFDKYREMHKRRAQSYNASFLVANNDYTAYISNEGKNISVYLYLDENKNMEAESES